MISHDVLALVRFDPPRIELCRVSNMQNGGGGEIEDIVMNSHGSSDPSDEPHMDKVCTLPLPLLRQQLGGTGSHARISRVFGVAELSGHQKF